MTIQSILIGILGLALLMIVHESGHFFAARAFGMRVITFSIGFGPTLFRVEPQGKHYWFTTLGGKVKLRLKEIDPEKGGDTTFQVGLIPFLAYVQIAGMNPFEDQDPDDKGSYANASLLGRIVTIFAGPLANYLFASVFFFFAVIHGGSGNHTQVKTIEGRPAVEAGMKDGDRIIRVNGKDVVQWTDMAKLVSGSPGKPVEMVVLRDGAEKTVSVTPENKDGKGLIGVMLDKTYRRPVSLKEAGTLAVLEPPMVVKATVTRLAEIITGRVKPELGGVVHITKEMARASQNGLADYLSLLGILSAYLGAFNLIPFPALDGGRLMFLGYEVATRRRPNPQIEAKIHVVGLMMLLGLMLYVTLFGQNDLNLGGG